jgi:cell division transport system ATP-binding protein
MIQMFDVQKHYQKDFSALKGVTLHVRKGEFVFITGPSGAGKTTLLKLIYCEERADQGQILVNARNLARLRDGSIPYLRRNIGVVFQDFKLIRSKSVFDNIAFALRVVGTPKREMKRRAWDVLRKVGLQHKMNSYPLRLSGGEQQRVAIARAVVNDPMILLADEPTGNLDASVTEEIMELVNEIHLRGTTVVMATHNLDIVERMKKRVIHLENGKCVSDTGTEEGPVLEEEKITQVNPLSF